MSAGVRDVRRYKVSDMEQQIVWRVAGPGGAATLSVLTLPLGILHRVGVAAPDAGVHYLAEVIGLHHAERPDDAEAAQFPACDALDGQPCWHDASSLAADELLRQWAAAGFDDDVVFAALDGWYLDRLEPTSRTVTP